MQRTTLTALVLAFALFGGGGVPVAAAEGSTTYYVDAAAGDDGDAGRAPGTAWQSLDRVNATAFSPGDRVLLRAGRSWRGQLWPKGSGRPGRPITVGRYGPVHGDGAFSDAVRLFDQRHWVIRDLEVTNAAPHTGEPGTNLRGIHIGGDPLHLGTITGPYGTGPRLDRALPLRVAAAASRAVDAGQVVSDNGGVGYLGRPVRFGTPDIGAFEC